MAEGVLYTSTIIFGRRINPDTDIGTTLQTSTHTFKAHSRSQLKEIKRLERECKALESQIQGNLTSLENVANTSGNITYQENPRCSAYCANANLNRNFQKPLVRPATYDGSEPWEDFRVHFQLVAEINNWTEDQKAMFWHKIYEEVHRQY
ncbi:hypothetical protein ACJMK2_027418 [Sinanodonta woodiana]|uniref:Uncharacterized protein n=1 Tax=Sinanodonta woodiana TaxID=1069815 RepID=A0ABD3XMK0_SINWO